MAYYEILIDAELYYVSAENEYDAIVKVKNSVCNDDFGHEIDITDKYESLSDIKPFIDVLGNGCFIE